MQNKKENTTNTEERAYDAEILSTWLNKLKTEKPDIDKEIDKTTVDISNERLRLKAATNQEQKLCHLTNIDTLLEYQDRLNQIRKEIFNIQIDFDGYNNGHSEYMVVDVDKNKFLVWAAIASINGICLAGVNFEEGNGGITVARFSACEKYAPQMNDMIKKAFPMQLYMASVVGLARI